MSLDVVTDPDTLATLAGRSAALLDETGAPVLELTLGPVVDRRTSGPFESFRLDLTGPGEPRLGQATYHLRLPDDRTTWWLLVPTAGDDASTTYTASFSREAR